jgi:hypothetical protein
VGQNGIGWSDCACVRAVRCHSDNPSEKEVLSCAEHLYATLAEGKYKNVFLVGEQAVTAYFSYQNNPHATFAKLRGFTVPDLKYNLWVSVISAPNEEDEYGSKYGEEIINNTIFLHDMKEACAYHKKPVPKMFGQYKEFLFPCDEQKAIQELEAVLAGKYQQFIAFDYETTGLRPYNEGHRIICCSVAVSKTKSFSFMITDKTASLLKKILRSPHIPKVAANMKFEKVWSRCCLGSSVNGLMLDTVVAAHVIDNRPGISSVKFQSFLYFGIYGYESSVERFISSTKEAEDISGANAFNSMHKCPTDILLVYVAMDSLLEYWIALRQKDKVI